MTEWVGEKARCIRSMYGPSGCWSNSITGKYARIILDLDNEEKKGKREEEKKRRREEEKKRRREDNEDAAKQ